MIATRNEEGLRELIPERFEKGKARPVGVAVRSTPTAPLWLSEGKSEFWATLDLRGDELIVGRHPETHIRLLRGLGFLPIDELLEKGESPFDATQRKQLIGARF